MRFAFPASNLCAGSTQERTLETCQELNPNGVYHLRLCHAGQLETQKPVNGLQLHVQAPSAFGSLFDSGVRTCVVRRGHDAVCLTDGFDHATQVAGPGGG